MKPITISFHSAPLDAAWLSATLPYGTDRRRETVGHRRGCAAMKLAVGLREKALANWRRAALRRKDKAWHRGAQYFTARAKE